MKIKPKQLITGIIIAFVLYAVIVNPDNAASYVRQAFVWLAEAVRSIFAFFDALLAKR